MIAAFNASFEACTKLINAAGLFGFTSGSKEESFCDGMLSSFANA
jgi:hypothetical protein